MPLPERYIVTVGRLMPNKNQRLLLDAYAAAHPAADLVILGGGPLREELLSRARDLGVADRVHLLGFVENPYAILARADFYVSASNSEGFPNSLVEAMAVGLAVISTNCPSGPSEILADLPRDTVTGFTLAPHGILVPTGDTTLLAEAIDRLSSDHALRARYGAAARARAEIYGVDRAVDGFWTAIERALAA
jgi:N-acetylgalactosamine-N,N'-diacetylbacillosaminyl-diphospho-undecaprenol 4-alpha-N-acetylgalactosaminyltransferase